MSPVNEAKQLSQRYTTRLDVERLSAKSLIFFKMITETVFRVLLFVQVSMCSLMPPLIFLTQCRL